MPPHLLLPAKAPTQALGHVLFTPAPNWDFLVWPCVAWCPPPLGNCEQYLLPSKALSPFLSPYHLMNTILGTHFSTCNAAALTMEEGPHMWECRGHGSRSWTGPAVGLRWAWSCLHLAHARRACALVDQARRARAVRKHGTGHLGDTGGPHSHLGSQRASVVWSYGFVKLAKLRHCDYSGSHTISESLYHTSPLGGVVLERWDTFGIWPRGSQTVETSAGV